MRLLEATGARVTAILHQDKSLERLEEHCCGFEKILVREDGEIAAAVRQARPDYVIHLSAAVTTERSVASIGRTMRANLLPSIDLLTACTELGVKRIVLMGSGEEYGRGAVPFDPASVLDPASPYGASKAAVSCYARMFHHAFHLPVTVLRPSVIYGPHQSSRMLIAQVMQSLLDDKEVDVTEGVQTRDFVYVEDVARGILAALTASGIDGEAWNLASGEVVTVRDCLERIERLTGKRGLIRYGAKPYNEREIFEYAFRTEETRAALGWQPQISLDAGLALTWQHLSERSKLGSIG